MGLDVLEPGQAFTAADLEQEPAGTENRGQQVIEVVRDPASQSPHRFHLLRLAVLDFETTHLCQIGRDQQRAGHAPAGILQRGSGETDGHRRSVLLAGRGLDPTQCFASEDSLPHALLVRRTLRDHGERTTDDVVRLPPVQRLGRGIPAAHVSARVDSVNRQRRAVDHSLQMAVCFTERTLRLQPPHDRRTHEQAGNRQNANVDQQGDVGARDAVHHEGATAADRVRDGQERHSKSQQRSTPRAKSKRGPNHERKQEVRVLCRLEKRRRHQIAENDCCREHGAAHKREELESSPTVHPRHGRAEPGEQHRSGHQRAEIIARPPQAKR